MSIEVKQFTVTADYANERLDAFLVYMLDEQYSRSALAKRIKAGDVSIDGKIIEKSSYKVQDGQQVTLQLPPPPVYDVVPTPVDFEVVAEEKDFLIINKPAGLTVHHSQTAPQDITLVHGLLHRYPEFADFDDHERPGIVHRLDKHTSGLLIVARNGQALTRLAALFKQRSVSKTYYALVHGYAPKEGTIDRPIGRHQSLRHKMAVDGVGARESTTHFKVVTYFEHGKETYTLLELDLITGRTHQIRVHLSSLGLPLVGDNLYGKESKRLPRQALHAGKISFTYQGTFYSYQRPYPADMVQFIAGLTPVEGA